MRACKCVRVYFENLCMKLLCVCVCVYVRVCNCCLCVIVSVVVCACVCTCQLGDVGSVQRRCLLRRVARSEHSERSLTCEHTGKGQEG